MVQRKLRKPFEDMNKGIGRGIGIGSCRFKIFSKILIAIFIFTFTSTFTLSSFAQENKFRPSGPFNVRNMMPMYMFYMSMNPDSAQTLKKGKTSIEGGYHVANTIIKQHDPWPGWKSYDELTYDILIDAEVSRFYADIKYGIMDNLEVGINVPYLIYSGGYLDSFIKNFEDAFSAIKTPNARESRPKNKYDVKVVHFGQTILEDTSKPDGLGEITLQAKYKIADEGKYMPHASLRAAIKLPTATNNASNMLGSKKIDYGFGVLADKRLFDRLLMYLNFNAIFIGKPEALEGLKVEDYMLTGLLGFEFFFTNRTSLIFQALGNTTVYEKGVPCMERDGVVISVGFNHNFNDKISWHIAMDENTNTAAPDFGLFTNLKVKL